MCKKYQRKIEALTNVYECKLKALAESNEAVIKQLQKQLTRYVSLERVMDAEVALHESVKDHLHTATVQQVEKQKMLIEVLAILLGMSVTALLYYLLFH
jgi:oligoribonuclease (3'-5' exoribonuclease)